ncbi:beta-ketoacyl-[acyl-carrier-protein] synthase family protein [Tropicibacter oceani]|uniref:3-oxoacyl-ACP synthase n=1 Tax=Tropicibacter oceani TaxID=3058420 RepID=A0ABY8QK44_9RHOB|nr:hypothetical protein [Tropicibacter oceani]WGW04517.1 hypothetical protein QF118_02910 [Tropicibacter oceani]
MRLASFSKYVPEGRIPVSDCVAATGASQGEAKAFGRLFGFDSVASTPADMTLEAAFGQVLDRVAPGAVLPDTLIYVHGNPVQYAEGRSPVQALVASHPILAGIEDVYEMDQQNCSTLFWALQAAQRLLADDARAVLVLAGDSLHQMPLGERYAPGVTAIGDAYCALLLDGEAGGTQIDNIWLKTCSQHYAGRFGTAAQSAAFNAEHTALVNAILDGTGFDVASDAPILPHNVNRLSWTLYAKQTGIDRDRIWLDLLPDQGHCYTVDAVSMLDRVRGTRCPEAALLSVGQGGFLGGCMVRREAA